MAKQTRRRKSLNASNSYQHATATEPQVCEEQVAQPGDAKGGTARTEILPSSSKTKGNARAGWECSTEPLLRHKVIKNR